MELSAPCRNGGFGYFIFSGKVSAGAVFFFMETNHLLFEFRRVIFIDLKYTVNLTLSSLAIRYVVHRLPIIYIFTFAAFVFNFFFFLFPSLFSPFF